MSPERRFAKLVEYADQQGLLIANVPQGYAVEVETANTIYLVAGKAIVAVDGSRSNGTFVGCTFSGSTLALGRLWTGGFIEFVAGEKTYTTTAIKRVDIVICPHPKRNGSTCVICGNVTASNEVPLKGGIGPTENTER